MGFACFIRWSGQPYWVLFRKVFPNPLFQIQSQTKDQQLIAMKPFEVQWGDDGDTLCLKLELHRAMAGFTFSLRT